MNDTTTTSAEQAIKDELRRLAWMIPDAQRRLNEHAQTMLRRAERAVKDMEAMMANQPCSMSWVEFAESDLRNAREAKAQLEFLYQQRTMLEFFLKQDERVTRIHRRPSAVGRIFLKCFWTRLDVHGTAWLMCVIA